jgi:endonuclease-3
MHRICDSITNDHGGEVPDSLEELLAFPGVGLKTANLVLSLGFGIPAICVDTHVHRISNRMGWIKPTKPDDSVKALEAVLPRKHWIEINELLVLYGQQVCTPRNPICSQCSLYEHCGRVGVEQSR